MSEATSLKDVYMITEREGQEKKFWTRIGIGFVNRDQSINVVLDAIPTNGRIQIRDRQSKTTTKGD